MKVTDLKYFCLFFCFSACLPFKPIAIYDLAKDQNTTRQEKVFFDESMGQIWLNFDQCATLKLVNHDGSNALLLDWNKIGCDWVGFGNSWSNFIADDISDQIQNSAISFRVKAVEAEQKSVPFVIGLEDYAGGNDYVFSTFNLFANKLSITKDEWTTINVPLWNYDFSYQGIDPTNIKQMIIQLEGAGKLYLDDIKIIPFTKDQYAQMLDDVEDLKPKGNPNQSIYPSNFQDLAWNIGKNQCHELLEKNNAIHWDWNSCDFYNRWGFNWNNWYAFNFRGIVDNTLLQIKLSSNFSPFTVIIEDYIGASSELDIKQYSPQLVNDSTSVISIPISDFNLTEKEFVLDRMKQFQFVGQGDKGKLVIYEMNLVKR
ncbi:MAG: hypothetical protein ACON5E_02915 [Flavobacteriales bacterium]